MPHPPQQPTFSLAEVSAHNTAASCWVIIHGAVCDVTSFLDRHPGGALALSKPGRAGCDVTERFEAMGHAEMPHVVTIMESLVIGRLQQQQQQQQQEETDGGVVEPSAAQSPSLSPSPHDRAVLWHATRRRAILKVHPEICELFGTNPWTLLVGVVCCAVHAATCAWAQLLPGAIVFALAYTIGAVCKMYQFMVCHELCHGLVTEMDAVRVPAMHLLTLPSFGMTVFEYYRHMHLGHHAKLGSLQLGNDPRAIFDAGWDGDLFAVGTTMLLREFPTNTLQHEHEHEQQHEQQQQQQHEQQQQRQTSAENAEIAAVSVRSPSVVVPVHHRGADESQLRAATEIPLLNRWALTHPLSKLVFDPVYMLLHFFGKLFCIDLGAGCWAVPLLSCSFVVVLCASTVLKCFSCCCSKKRSSAFTRTVIIPLTPEQRADRDAVIKGAARWFRDLGLQSVLWISTVVLLCHHAGPALAKACLSLAPVVPATATATATLRNATTREWCGAATSVAAGPSVESVSKAVLYLILSELFLYGWLFHPFCAYFLSVHRSRGVPPRAGSSGGAATKENNETGCQPTMSTYGLCASLSSGNLNYHVEHHDFPRVPWSRLPHVHRLAPEFYRNLEQSRGWCETIRAWLKHGGSWHYACHD